MKKAVLVLIVAAQALLLSVTSFGHNVTITRVRRIPATNQVEFMYTQNALDSISGIAQYSASPLFTTVPSTKLLGYIGDTAGVTRTDTMSTPPGLTGYVRIITTDTSGASDTSQYKIMWRNASVDVVLDSTTDGFTQRITYDPGNFDSAKMYSVVGWDASFSSIWNFDSVIYGMPIGTSVIRYDTATGLSYPTHFYVRTVIIGALNNDTVIIQGNVKAPLLPATVVSGGVPTSTTSSIAFHVIGNVYGSTSANSLMLYYHHGSPTSAPFDSASFTPLALPGGQDFYSVVSGLAPMDTVYATAKIRNSVGSGILASPIMGVTLPSFALWMSGSMTISHDTLTGTMHFSTVPGSGAHINVQLAEGTPDNIVQVVPYTVMPYSGSASGVEYPKFAITDASMTYYMYVSGTDSPAYTILNGADTLSLLVEPCAVDSFTADADTVIAGHSTVLRWSASNATTAYISGIGYVSDTGSITTPLLYSTTDFTLTAQEINTVVVTKTVYVKPAPTGITEVNGSVQCEAGTLIVHDMTGKKVVQRSVMSGEIVDKSSLVPGTYIAQLVTADGKALPAQKITIR